MKVSIVAPMGMTPPVITEFLQYVEEGLQLRVTDLVVISTNDDTVVQGVDLVRFAVKDKHPHIRFHEFRLPFSDIDSQHKCEQFITMAIKILREQKMKHRVDNVYICVAGGRKEVSIILSLLSQFLNVNGVYHIVMSDVHMYNQALELVRHEIAELHSSHDKESYYRQHKDKFDMVMYPPLSQYNIIKIPIVPYPSYALDIILNVLKNKVGIANINTGILCHLQKFGYVKISRGKLRITEEGRQILKLLSEITK